MGLMHSFTLAGSIKNIWQQIRMQKYEFCCNTYINNAVNKLYWIMFSLQYFFFFLQISLAGLGCWLNSCTWDGVFTSCGLALLLVWALLHLLLDRCCLRFLSLQLTQKISSVSDCLVGPTVVLLLNPACVIHHALSWTVKSSHDKCDFSLYGTAVLASHFQPPLSSRSLCACKICFVGKIQRQGVSFAKINVI